MMAGFAEGRHEIEADFIDTVVAAEGGTLEDELEEITVQTEGKSMMPATSSELESSNK